MREDDTKDLVVAKESLVRTGRLPEDLAVRSEIADSWHRSVLSGLDPAEVFPSYDEHANLDGHVWTAAEPIAERRGGQLADTPNALIIADRNGRILHRSTSDAGLQELFEAFNVSRGFNFEESAIGTNGIGTVLEIERPIRITGSEHFMAGFQPLTCVGVPIKHPISGQIQGTLNITCRTEDFNSLILPFALEAAHEIERRLYLSSSRNERLLLEQFLSGQRRSRGQPLISLNEQIVISNPAAGRILDEIGQTLLWEHAGQAIASGSPRRHLLELPSGHAVATLCHPVTDGAEIIGALVELDPSPQAVPRRRAISSGASAGELPGLVGRGAAWRTLVDQVIAYRDGGLPLFLTGQAGTGKSAVLSAAFADAREEGRLHVFEGTMEPIEGAAAWIRELRAATEDRPDAVILVRHLEALDDTAARALGSLVEGFATQGGRLVGTVTPDERAAQTSGSPIEGLTDGAIHVPPLKDRLEDLPYLLSALTRRHALGGIEPRWLPDAVQTLTRLSWPANVRQLDNLVRRVLAGRRSADIRAKDLPEDIRRQAPRRTLSYIEQVELEAMMTALQRTNGNKTEAAQMLGVSRATFYRRIRSFGLDLGKTAY
jgi:transcriptional regulator of acetoin/glycerol metabolism